MAEDKTQFTYKVIQESEDPSANLIQKSGLTREFTLTKLKADRTHNETYARQFQAQHDLEVAKMDNVMFHNPWIKDLTEEQLSTAHFFFECKKLADILAPKIKELNDAVEDIDAEVVEIEKQVGIAIPMSVVRPDVGPIESRDVSDIEPNEQ